MKANLRIVEFTNPSGEVVHRVTGKNKDGQRVRENFKTIEEATARKQQLEIEVLNMPATVPLVATRLTAEQAAQAEWAFAELKGKDIRQAIRYYLDNYREPLVKIGLREAFDKFMAEKKRENCRPRTLANLKSRIDSFTRQHEGRLVSDITSVNISEAIHRAGVSPQTINNDRAALTGFFNWCLKHDYCGANPCAKVDAVRQDEKEVAVLSLADVQSLMEAAISVYDGKMVPYFALGIFCALRPNAELARLKWGDVDLTERELRVRSTTKTRRNRMVAISDNCLEWIAPHALKYSKDDKIPFSVRMFDRVRKLAGFYYSRAIADLGEEKAAALKPWPEDVMRHTGASNHLAHHGSSSTTADWAGHDDEVLHKKYKSLVKKSDAKLFWEISPKSAFEPSRKVVSISAAA